VWITAHDEVNIITHITHSGYMMFNTGNFRAWGNFLEMFVATSKSISLFVFHEDTFHTDWILFEGVIGLFDFIDLVSINVIYIYKFVSAHPTTF
jgi:hypothetical protein